MAVPSAEDASFLDAIIAAPDDDTPRLVFERDVPAYLREPLPALSQLTLRSADGPAMHAMSDRPLTSLTWHASGDAQRMRPPIGAELTTLVARTRLDPTLAEAIASSSSLERLTLLHDATEDVAFTPPPSLRELTLHLQGVRGAEACSFHHRFMAGAYDALEVLRLGPPFSGDAARFPSTIDGSIGRVALPALSELELIECVLDPSSTAALVGHPDLGPLYRPSFLRCTLSDPAALRARWSDALITSQR